MSKLTSTNEETLIQLLNNLEPGHYLHLRPHSHPTPMIDVYKLPNGFSFEYASEEERDKYWECSLMALAIHKDVWQADIGVATSYR